jgi:hypothetical protein
LTKDGIEPNPGPSWDEFLSEVKKKFPSSYERMFPALAQLENTLLEKLDTLAVTTDVLKDFLVSKEGQDYLKSIKLATLARELIEIIDSLEGVNLLLI